MIQQAKDIRATATAAAAAPSLLLDHIDEISSNTTQTSTVGILANLMSKIPVINFREEAKLEEEAKVKLNHILIIVIEKLLQIALSNDWGMCRNGDFVYLYNGSFWSLLDKNTLKDFLGKCAEAFGVDIYKSRHFKFKDDLYRQFESSANLTAPERDKSVQLINLINGTYEIKNHVRRLRASRREDFLNYRLPFEFNSDSQCPLFNKFLFEVLPDGGLQSILAEYIGYIFVRNISLSKVLILLGGGSNGKSVFFDIITALLGSENVSNYSLESLTDSKGYERASIANKLLNYASEINGKLQAAVFKQMASDEPIEARLPYGNPMILKSYARLMFNCNELPKDVEFTHAFFRRFMIIPFDQTIAKEDQDPELAKKIISKELSGVFNWVLRGMQRVITNKKFTQSDKMDKVLKSFKTDADSVRSYLQDNQLEPCRLKEGESYLSVQYEAYKDYCNEDGLKRLGKKNFKKRIESLGAEIKRNNKGMLIGVKVSQ